MTLHQRAALFFTLLFAALTLFPAATPSAQNVAGRLDATFGTGGVVMTDINGGDDEATAVLLQPDGKIVVAGRDGAPTAMFTVIRYLPDGRLDTSFGDGGKTRIAILSQFSYATSITRLPDGGLVVGGYLLLNDGTEQLALVKLTADGQRDMSFGQIGYVIGPFNARRGTTTRLQKVVALPDGKLVFVGYGTFFTPSGIMCGLRADGSLDTSFGFSGEGSGGGDDLLIQPDGKLVSASSGCFLMRTNPDGSGDQSFRGSRFGGAVYTRDLGGIFKETLATSPAVAIAPDGKVVLACSVTKPGMVLEDDFVLVRFNGNGSLDTGFGTNGVTVVDVGANDHVKALMVQPDGKILLAGYSGTDDSATQLPLQAHVTLLRFNTDGSLDASFKADPLPADQHGVSVANAAVLQSDGRVVVVGRVRTASGSDLFVARYETGLSVPEPTPPDFSLAADPATVTVARGDKATFRININRTGGFTGGVSVAVPEAVPAKVQVALPNVAADGSFYIGSLKVKGKAKTGSYPLVFEGIDSTGRKRSTTVTLIIT